VVLRAFTSLLTYLFEGDGPEENPHVGDVSSDSGEGYVSPDDSIDDEEDGDEGLLEDEEDEEERKKKVKRKEKKKGNLRKQVTAVMVADDTSKSTVATGKRKATQTK